MIAIPTPPPVTDVKSKALVKISLKKAGINVILMMIVTAARPMKNMAMMGTIFVIIFEILVILPVIVKAVRRVSIKAMMDGETVLLPVITEVKVFI